MKHVIVAIFSVFSILLIISCDRQNSETPPPSAITNKNTDVDGQESSEITVTDENGQYLPTARVLIGDQNPWLEANELGAIPIPADWTTPHDLTVEAPGYIRITLKQQNPSGLSIKLQKKSQIPQLPMNGTVSGITTSDKDGYVDFAILLDSLSKSDVLNFNINKVISPWTEKIKIAGFEFPIPQNIFLPKQKESYFITVTLQKPWFNLFYDSYGAKALYSLRGKFPLKKVLSELQNKKPYFELVNHFDFSSVGSLTHDFTTVSTPPSVVAAQIALDKSYSVQAPVTASSQVILGISTFKEKNFYQPLDVKYMQSAETITFKTSQTTNPYFIGVLKNKDEFSGDSAAAERMSISIDTPKNTVNYLPLTKEPTWISTTQLQIDLPSAIDSNFIEQGMVVVISELQNLTLPDGKTIKYKLPLWQIHSSNWTSTIEIPDIESTTSTPRRVEVTLLATTLDNSGQQSPVTLTSNYEERLDTATHLTKSARDY